MKIENPAVTLNDEARGITQDAAGSAFLDWLCAFSAVGDDGKQYWFGCSPLILNLEKIDMCNYELCTEMGEVIQDPQSIYKVAKFPGVYLQNKQTLAAGTHTVQQQKNKVIVDIAFCHIECNADYTWHIVIDDSEKKFKADFYHRPSGGPLWYGRDTPSHLTAHSVTYGYNWSGAVEGDFTLNGNTVHFQGAGIRERYVAIDSSAAEIGGWEDWGWFHFDEVFGSMYDMRLGMKDMAINLVEEQIYIPEGKLTIDHHEWAYLPQYGGFVPTLYKVTIQTDEGVLYFQGHVANARVWGVTGKVPDHPVATLEWDHVEGTFEYPDGHIKTLTNGFGGMSIRQWRSYPNITPLNFGTTGLEIDNRLETL